MASGYGMDGHVLWNFQDSFGTSQTTSLHAISIVNENIVFNKEQIVEAGMYGRFSESPYHEGANLIEGDITLEANPTAIGHIFKSVIGLTSTTSDTGKQVHLFEPRQEDFDCRAAGDAATIEIFRDVGSAAVYHSMVGNNLSLDIANGELLTLTAGFMGAGFTRKAAGTPTFDTAKPFIWDVASASYNGADIVDLRDLSLNFNNNLEATHTMTGAKFPYRIKRTAQSQAELSGTFVFAAHSYWQAWESQAENSFTVMFTGDTPHTLKLDIPSLRFKTFEPTMGGAGLVEASFTAQAIYNTDSANPLSITLENTQTYY